MPSSAKEANGNLEVVKVTGKKKLREERKNVKHNDEYDSVQNSQNQAKRIQKRAKNYIVN
jgi:hypothetical protein